MKLSQNYITQTDKIICNNILHFVKSKPNIYKHFNFYYHRQKHKLSSIIPIILVVLRRSLPWYFVAEIFKISKSTVYDCFMKLSKFNVFENNYILLLNKYVKKASNKLFKIRTTDTSTIINKYGKNIATRTPFCKKKMIKLSLITFKNGLPYNIRITTGKENDAKILNDQLETKNLIEIKNINTDVYFLADKGYDSSILRQKIKKEGMIAIIPSNKRNTKNIDKIKVLTKEEKTIYNKRIIIENIFSIIKNRYKRLDKMYESTIRSYKNLLYIALMGIIKTI